jgi:hypothetical protein
MISPVSSQLDLLSLLDEQDQARALYESARDIKTADAARLRSELLLLYNRALRQFNTQLLGQLHYLERVSHEITLELRPFMRSAPRKNRPPHD